MIQRAADAVVVEQPRLPLNKAQQRRLEPGSPTGQAVERLARHAQIADQHTDRGRGRQRRARIPRGQVTRERARQIDPAKELADHRQRAELGGRQLERAGSILMNIHPSDSTYTLGQAR